MGKIFRTATKLIKLSYETSEIYFQPLHWFSSVTDIFRQLLATSFTLELTRFLNFIWKDIKRKTEQKIQTLLVQFHCTEKVVFGLPST